MKFAYPFLLLLVPAILLLAWRAFRTTLSSAEKRRFPPLAGAVVFLVVALCKPYWRTVPEQQVVKGVDLVVLLDVSQSMFCQDGEPRRIDQARNLMRVLLPEFTGSSVTVIYFAGDAQVGCPLTTDLPSVFMFLSSVTAGMTAKPGTNLAAVTEALRGQLNDGSGALPASSKKVLLMFSDGEFFHGSSAEFNDFVRSELHAPVFAFLCGKTRSPVPTFDLARFHPNAFSLPRPENLARMAASTSGYFYDLAGGQQATIDRQVLKQVGDVVREGTLRPDYQPGPFLLVSLLLFLCYQLFPILAPLAAHSRRPVTTAAMFLALLLATTGMGRNEERRADFEKALSLARQEKYDDSLKILRQLQQEGASEDIEVAIGNVEYARGSLDQAIEMYSKAIERNAMNQRARWNWEVALKQKENQSKQQQQPPSSPPPSAAPPPFSPQADARLKYFDQLEQEQMRQSNPVRSNDQDFAW